MIRSVQKNIRAVLGIAALLFQTAPAWAETQKPVTTVLLQPGELAARLEGQELLPDLFVSEQNFKATPLVQALKTLYKAESALKVADPTGKGARTRVTAWQQSGTLQELTGKLCQQAGLHCRYSNNTLTILDSATVEIPLPDALSEESMQPVRDTLATRIRDAVGMAANYDPVNNVFVFKSTAANLVKADQRLRRLRQDSTVVHYDVTVLSHTATNHGHRLPWETLSDTYTPTRSIAFNGNARNAADVFDFLEEYGKTEIVTQFSKAALAGETVTLQSAGQTATLRGRFDGRELTIAATCLGKTQQAIRSPLDKAIILPLAEKAASNGKAASRQVLVMQPSVTILQGTTEGMPSLAAAVSKRMAEQQATAANNNQPSSQSGILGALKPITRPLKKLASSITGNTAATPRQPAPVIVRGGSGKIAQALAQDNELSGVRNLEQALATNPNGKVVFRKDSPAPAATPAGVPAPSLAGNLPPSPSDIPIIPPANARPEDLELIREMEALPGGIPGAAASMPISTAADTAAKAQAAIIPPPPVAMPAPAPVYAMPAPNGAVPMVMVPASMLPGMQTAPTAPVAAPPPQGVPAGGKTVNISGAANALSQASTTAAASGAPQTLGDLKNTLKKPATAQAEPTNNTAAQAPAVAYYPVMPVPNAAATASTEPAYTDKPTRGKWLTVPKQTPPTP